MARVWWSYWLISNVTKWQWFSQTAGKFQNAKSSIKVFHFEIFEFWTNKAGFVYVALRMPCARGQTQTQLSFQQCRSFVRFLRRWIFMSSRFGMLVFFFAKKFVNYLTPFSVVYLLCHLSKLNGKTYAKSVPTALQLS